jgi:hypothetical protein
MRANMKLLAHAMNIMAASLTLNAAQRAACKRSKQHHATAALTPASHQRRPLHHNAAAMATPAASLCASLTGDTQPP